MDFIFKNGGTRSEEQQVSEFQIIFRELPCPSCRSRGRARGRGGGCGWEVKERKARIWRKGGEPEEKDKTSQKMENRFQSELNQMLENIFRFRTREAVHMETPASFLNNNRFYSFIASKTNKNHYNLQIRLPFSFS